MRILQRWFTLSVFAGFLLLTQQANAASLVGKVIEVQDGDEITIFNLNRPVRIKLIGIDAPEKEQPFGAVARQHLFDLVFDKTVAVEYSGIGEQSRLIGRVTLNDADINAQMIRDGAAWFDPKNQTRLTETQRQVYLQCEQAARSEKRGLWEQEGAVAPWEFVKAEALRKSSVATVPPVAPSQPKKSERPTAELTSMSLLRTGTALPRQSSPIDVESTNTNWATGGSFRRNWKKFQPAGESFTALLPEGGEQGSKTVAVGDQNIEIFYHRSRDGNSFFELVWFKGPYQGETDADAIQAGLRMIINGVSSGYEAAGGVKFQCEPTSQTPISAAGYVGREFDLTGCTAPGMVRVYTKVIGNERQLYLGFTFYREDDENVWKFLKSFTVSGGKKDVKQKPALK